MRKNVLLVTGLIMSFILVNAQSNFLTIQDSSTMTPQRWRDTVFGLLNRSSSQIPSGYLLDYSIGAFNDSNFNSLINTKIDTISDAGIFFAIHNILNAAVVNASATSIGNTDSLFINAKRYQRNTGNIPLLFLYQPFQKIRKTAQSQNLLSISADGFRLQDVSGRSISPYDNRYLFAFSPVQNIVTQFNNVNFTLPSQFWLMPGVTSVQVDFGDGQGFRNLSQNSSVSIYYSASGTYYLNAKITTTAGTFTAKSSISYTQPKYYLKADTVWNISVAPVYTSISNYISANGGNLHTLDTPSPCSDGSVFDQVNCDINPGANVTVINGCDHVFDKPIIVIEGFDPTGIVDLKALTDQVDYQINGPSFYSTMKAAGYDFVFVIFTKNTSFVENNAQVIEQVIQKVNATKTGNNKSTVIGISMGGLIARWALKDMEDKNIAHQVGYYFSYDSPHQGANIPLGLQNLFSQMQSDLPFLKYDGQFNKLGASRTSPAAQEMLVLNTISANSSALNQVRAIFAQNLITKGYPHMTTANIAISLGRGNNTTGTTNAGNGTQFGNFNPGSAIFNGNIQSPMVNIATTVYAVPVNSTNGTICNYHFSGLKPGKIFGIFPAVIWDVRKINTKFTGTYPYDDAPAGYENTQSQFVDDFNGKFTFWTNGPSVNTNGAGATAVNYGHFGHAFVPVASALDLQNQGYSSANNFQSNNMYYALDNSIVSPGQVTGNTVSPSTLSPFQYISTYTSDCSSGVSCQSVTDDPLLKINAINKNQYNNWNQWHEAYISNQAQLFIQRKILNTNSFNSCTTATDFCSELNILVNGPSAICSTGTYHLQSIFPLTNVSYQWSSVNSKFKITGGQGTPTIIVSKLTDGADVVKVIITNSCGLTSTFIENVTIGLPAPTVTVSLDCPDGQASATNSVGAISYTWDLVDVNTHQETINSNYGSVINYRNLIGTHNIGATYTNGCGTSSAGVVYNLYCPGSGGHLLTVSPNPASNNITVAVNSGAQSLSMTKSDASAIPTMAKMYKIRILDQSGSIKKNIAYDAGVTTVTINIDELVNGTYILQAYYNNAWVNEQLIILK